MKHSKINIDTVNDSNDISSILFKSKLLLDDLGNDMINTWIDSELNRYDKDEQIPNYRRITSPLYGRIQTICSEP